MDTQPATRTTSLAELVEAIEAEGPTSPAVRALIAFTIIAQETLRVGGAWFTDIANGLV